VTLILSAATRDVAYQIADTKLSTPTGRHYDDKLTKTTILHCRDAKLAISYTGLAIIDGKRTDGWLVAKLREVSAPEKVFIEVLESLTSALTSAIARNAPLLQHGLSLEIVGLGYSPGGVRQPAVAVVTNIQKPTLGCSAFGDIFPPARCFSRFVLQPKFSTFISASGAVGTRLNFNGLRRAVERKLRLAKTDCDYRSIMDDLVTMARLQRRDREMGHWIGEDYTAVMITKDFRSSSFFYTHRHKVSRFPNIVRSEFTIENLRFEPPLGGV
jgi:hypothetical protein